MNVGTEFHSVQEAPVEMKEILSKIVPARKLDGLFEAYKPQAIFMLSELELMHCGLTQKEAERIRAIYEFRFLNIEEVKTPMVNSPADAYVYMKQYYAGLEKEGLGVLVVNIRNAIVGFQMIYYGAINSSQVRVGELFVPAIRVLGSSIIVCHNHPSGDPTPSPDDVAVTRAIVQAGKLLDISLLDHIIIGGDRWISLKERGLGFS